MSSPTLFTPVIRLRQFSVSTELWKQQSIMPKVSLAESAF